MMAKIRITKQFTFEMAHALQNYDGPCKNIHGHSYELFVTVLGTPINDPQNSKNGMLIDFGDLKKIVRTHIVDLLDHALVLNQNMDKSLISVLREQFANVKLVDYQPTSENMLIEFAQILKKKLPTNVILHSLKLRETCTSFAEWYATDND
jgi:6-pyruvoyltetrahydropterin/6-carboxytetrahydropterin synthase